MRFQWSDLQYFLAVARTGSTSEAARALGLNQTTCARRISALETALGMTLFDRGPTGYKLTPFGSSLVTQAQVIESAAHAIGEQAAEMAVSQRFLIRFTTSDWIADQIAQTAVAQFAQLRPDIRIVLNVHERRADLTAGEADVALRGGFALDEPSLIGKKVAETPWAFYCSKKYAEQFGPPRSMREALGRPLATPAGLAEVVLRKLRDDVNIAYSTNSTAALIEAVARNNFVGTLPCAVGNVRADLQLCCPIDHSTPNLWIVYPDRLRRSPQIRAFIDHLSEHVKAWKRSLEKRGKDDRAKIT